MHNPYAIATQLADVMTKINCAWYTREDQVSLLTHKLTKGAYQKR